MPPAPAQSIDRGEVSARAGFFAKMKSGLVQNMEVLYEPLTGVLLGNCFRPASNFGIFWGGEMRFFSVTASNEQLVYGIEHKGKPSGTACKD